MTAAARPDMIRDLARAGQPVTSIAQAANIPVANVRSHLTRLRRAGVTVPDLPAAPPVTWLAVAALTRCGLSTEQIAAALQKSPNCIRILRHHAKGAGLMTGVPAGYPSRQVHLSAGVCQALAPHAAARGILSAEIAQQILAACAAEPALIDNVLDDGVAG